MRNECACADEGVSANPLAKGLFPLNLLRPALRNYIFRGNARANVMGRAPRSFQDRSLPRDSREPVIFRFPLFPRPSSPL